MSKAPYIIGIPPGKRELWIERHRKTNPYIECFNDYGMFTGYRWDRSKDHNGYWLVPLSTNPARTLGDFLKLYDNGKIERITLRPDHDDVVVVIKPEDR